MHVSCIQAGMLLARLGRPEVTNCITGLEQYAYAYEECAEQAAEIKRVYGAAVSGEQEHNHMASVVARGATDVGVGTGIGGVGEAMGGAGNAMNIDQPMFGF